VFKRWYSSRAPGTIPVHHLEGLQSLDGIAGIELLPGPVRYPADELGIEKTPALGWARSSLASGAGRGPSQPEAAVLLMEEPRCSDSSSNTRARSDKRQAAPHRQVDTGPDEVVYAKQGAREVLETRSQTSKQDSVADRPPGSTRVPASRPPLISGMFSTNNTRLKAATTTVPFQRTRPHGLPTANPSHTRNMSTASSTAAPAVWVKHEAMPSRNQRWQPVE